MFWPMCHCWHLAANPCPPLAHRSPPASCAACAAQGFDSAYAATTRGWESNLGAFAAGNIGQLDMIMLDYPGRDSESIRGQWRSFEAMHAKGLARTLAVSNFSPAQLDVILSDPETTVKPTVRCRQRRPLFFLAVSSTATAAKRALPR